MNARPISCSSMSCNDILVGGLKVVGYIAVAASVALFVTGLFATGGGTAAVMLSALHLTAKYAIYLGTPGTVAFVVLAYLKIRSCATPQVPVVYGKTRDDLLVALTANKGREWQEAGGNVNVTNSYGQTALFSLVKAGDKERIERLLALPRVDIDQPDGTFAETPLKIARDKQALYVDIDERLCLLYTEIISLLERYKEGR